MIPLHVYNHSTYRINYTVMTNAFDQSAQSQLGVRLTSNSRTSLEIVEDSGEASFTSFLNIWVLSWGERASAALFFHPARCTADRVILCLAQKKQRHLKRCIASGWELDLLLIIVTAAALSQWHRMCFSCIDSAQIAQEIMIRNSSLTEMWASPIAGHDMTSMTD